ncbi:MAG TPA: hypothetical protein VGP27_01430 [Mycobacterium sp.]|jgi:hypothetical protein|nr:hypothetical protein [Mycobacterium sp.]
MANRGNALVRRPAVVFGLVIAHEPLAGDAHDLAATANVPAASL